MNKTKTVSRIDFGNALIAACRIFGSYKIVAASIRIPADQRIRVYMRQDEDAFHRIFAEDDGKRGEFTFVSADEVRTAEKPDVLVELTKLIAITNGERNWVVNSIEPDIPDKISVRVQCMPKGSLLEEPVFDGSIE